jgi:tetratricopeptide (TPR) repeat protein
MKRELQYVLFALVCAIAYAFYAPTFESTVLFDDTARAELTAFSPEILDDESSWLAMMLQPRWLPQFVNQATVLFAGLQVDFFRTSNFILHLLLALLFLLIFNFLFDRFPQDSWVYARRNRIVLLAIGLFLLHPVQVQTALNVLQMRLEALLALCLLLVLCAFIRLIFAPVEWYRSPWFAILLGTSFVLVGAKESSIIAPLLLFVVDLFLIARGNLQELMKRKYLYLTYGLIFYAMYALVNSHVSILGLLLGKMTVLSSPGCLVASSYQKSVSSYEYLLTQFPALFHYVRVFVFPVQLCWDYQFSLVTSLVNKAFLASVVGVVGIGVFVAYVWKVARDEVIPFSIIWFFVALVPRSSLMPSSELVADYKAFLASIGVMLCISYVVWLVLEYVWHELCDAQSAVGRWGYWICVIIFCGGIVQLSSVQKELWKEPVVFWRYVCTKTPSRARSFYNLGKALVESGAVDEGIEKYYKAITLDSAYAEPLIALGEYYQQHNDLHKAQHYYDRAESCELCNMRKVFENRAALATSLGMLQESVSYFEKAVSFKECSAETYFKYAQALKRMRRFKEAYEAVQIAVQKNLVPSIEMELLRARLAFELGNYRDVVTTLESVPPSAFDMSIQFILAASYYSLENYKKAADFFEVVYHKRPDNLDVVYNYAQSLMQSERYSQAISLFQQCVEHEKYPFAQLHVATCFYKNGNVGTARNLFAQIDKKEELSEPVRFKLAALKKDLLIA